MILNWEWQMMLWEAGRAAKWFRHPRRRWGDG